MERLERFDEAIAAAPGDCGVFVCRVHLGYEVRGAFRRVSTVEVEIDGFRCDSGKLFVEDARRAKQHGASWIANRLVGNLLHVIGDESDVNAREILGSQRLREIKRTIEAAIESFFERRFGCFRSQRTTGEQCCAAGRRF